MQEFDIAFHHNIMVKRKKRLVVLMALDCPTELYDNDASDAVTLRQYLRQYTYIDYTTDDWLDKLLYTLPLRGLYALQNAQTTVNYAMEGDEQYESSPDSHMLLIGPFPSEYQPNPNYKVLISQ